MQQGVTNRTYFISLFKQRLRDQYIQQWFTSVSTRSSCSIYKNITNHFRCQNYFHMVTNCKHRISLIRFRTKNHSLSNVIQGRGRNRRPYNERLCPTCNVLGDEFHCLFECENTRHIRHVLPRYYTFRPNMFNFSSLLSSEEPSVLRKLAKFFIYVILSLRANYLIQTQTKLYHLIASLFTLYLLPRYFTRQTCTCLYMSICMHTDCKSIAE